MRELINQTVINFVFFRQDNLITGNEYVDLKCKWQQEDNQMYIWGVFNSILWNTDYDYS